MAGQEEPDALVEFLIELEMKYTDLAFEAIEARKRVGLEVTEEWLDALEREHQAMAIREIAGYGSSDIVGI